MEPGFRGPHRTDPAKQGCLAGWIGNRTVTRGKGIKTDDRLRSILNLRPHVYQYSFGNGNNIPVDMNSCICLNRAIQKGSWSMVHEGLSGMDGQLWTVGCSRYWGEECHGRQC